VAVAASAPSSTSPRPSTLSAALRPRVEYYPRHLVVGDFGDEAIALAAAAGLHLDEWQQDALRIMLSYRADGTWVCPDYVELVARQNGKGAILEARALAGLFLLGERRIVWTAHETKTTDEAFLRLKSLIDRLVEIGWLGAGDVKERQTNGQQGFHVVSTGQRIKFIARSKGSGRGFSGDLVIIDEAYDYTIQQAAALEPTMLARPNPQTVYTSTPPLSGDTGQPLYDLRDRADAGLDDQLAYRDWGLAGDLEDIDEIDVNDPKLWARTNPSYNKRISAAGIRRLLKKLGKTDFARESLGIWPRRIADERGILTVEEWEARGDADSQLDDDHGVCIAFAVSRNRERASIAICGLRYDGLLHWELIDDRPGVDWLVPRLLALKAKWRPKLFAMNGKGATAVSLPDLLKAGFREPTDRKAPERGDLVVLGPQDVADSFGLVVDAIRGDKARHREDARLNSAFAAAKTRPIGVDGLAWAAKGTAHITPLEAITEANWVEEALAHLIVEDLEPSVW
jgi:hypothetical protein